MYQTEWYLGAMKPSGGVFPSLASPLIFVPEGTQNECTPVCQYGFSFVCIPSFYLSYNIFSLLVYDNVWIMLGVCSGWLCEYIL